MSRSIPIFMPRGIFRKCLIFVLDCIIAIHITIVITEGRICGIRLSGDKYICSDDGKAAQSSTHICRKMIGADMEKINKK